MSIFLIVAIVAAILNVAIGLAVFLGERGFSIDLRRGPRRSDRRRFGGRRHQDALV
jgi:hypothetical protein